MTAFGQSDWPIEVTGLVPPQQTRQVKNDERSVRELASENGPNWREARVEFHRRFAFPAACFAFALIAVPIGAQPRRGGRAAGSLIAVLLIAGYYLLLIFGSGLAREGTLPPVGGLMDGERPAGDLRPGAAAAHGAISRRGSVVPLLEPISSVAPIAAAAQSRARTLPLHAWPMA